MTDFMDILCAQYRRRDPNAELPIACRDIDENQYLRGLRTLDILQAQGYTQGPATPIRGLTSAAYNLTTDEAAERLEAVFEHAQDMEHHRSAILNRERKAREAGLSKMLLTDELVAEISGGHAHSAADLTEEQMAHIDPLNPFGNGAAKIQQHYDHLASRAVDHAHFIFNDAGLWHFVQTHKDLDRDEMLQMFREQMFKDNPARDWT